ncbi:unnamed protein product [Durusdinium trenchii]|uniref:Uncharacterized protein n=1 Tax=Durusdinium trenchii TaxID=1381693 RepID=A0ABP0R5W3_9DINO
MAICAEAACLGSWSESEASEDTAATWADLGSPPTCARSSSCNHSLAQGKADSPQDRRTGIVLDWDDTLFPLTHVYCDLHLDLQKPLEEQNIPEAMKALVAKKLQASREEVARLLSLATSLGEVMIVTLSKDSWVAESSRNFFPGLQEMMTSLGVRVICAQGPSQRGESMLSFSSRLKAEAITSACSEGTWRSLISIGDSDFERFGCRAAAEELQNKQECPVFTKTFKSMEKPTAEELTKQLRHITEWLPLLVAIPSDVDLDLVDVEDENIKAVSISNGVNTMRRFEERTSTSSWGDRQRDRCVTGFAERCDEAAEEALRARTP